MCLLKQGFNFADPTFLALAGHLANNTPNTVLRIGGSDQNSFEYDFNTSMAANDDADPTIPCKCGGRCVMPMQYWQTVTDMVKTSGFELVFGLRPDVDQATEFVTYNAKKNTTVLGYTFGNELDSPGLFDGYHSLRKLLDSNVFQGQTKPKLAGPDVALMRHASLEDALANKDKTIQDKLAWVSEFVGNVSSDLDVVSWHTYDFETYDIGTTDHHPLHPSNKDTSRLWDTRYADIALRLANNVSDIARELAPHADVWLSESDQICHQGVYNATNAYLNNLFMVQRWGMLPIHSVNTMMARQSLIGYNYSLLGSWPEEPIAPNPAYFTTILFQQLVGSTYLAAQVVLEGKSTEPSVGQPLRAYAYCSRAGKGSVVVTLINFQAHDTATVTMNGLGPSGELYALRPVTPDSNPYPFTSRVMSLNGKTLEVDREGRLPAMDPVPCSTKLTLPPLTVTMTVWPQANLEICEDR